MALLDIRDGQRREENGPTIGKLDLVCALGAQMRYCRSFPPVGPNGVEWKGVIQFTASVRREFAHGKMFSGILSMHKPDVWSEWKEAGGFAIHAVPIEKKNGRITMNQRLPIDRKSMDCTAIPR